MLLRNLGMAAFTIGLPPSQLRPIVLASQSPRRKELLAQILGSTSFLVIPSQFDEATLLPLKQQSNDGEVSVETYVITSASKKCEDVWKSKKYKSPNSIVIGSDTVVSLADLGILEKPVDHADAARMLTALSGNFHDVHTGVSLRYKTSTNEEQHESFSVSTRVKFSELSQQDIDMYINTGEPMDKAGSYGIQGIGGQFVESIEGDYHNVVGLPLNALSKALAKILKH
ncbi:hypothetical protein ScalyP_jg6616 [Parmales sp. scaly parma]|nr:hypothetical protein ScalyP_jg6616 [Parmales sp. scaly parma]